MAPEATSSEAMPVSPSTISPNVIDRESGAQTMELAVAFIPEVTSRASPPVAGTVYTSPPTAISSLMIPPMNAMVRPSGDHVGRPIWSEAGGR